MALRGHIENGVVVFDEPAEFPDGTLVQVEAVSSCETQLSEGRKKRLGGQWKGQVSIAADFDQLPDDLAEAFGLRNG